MKEENFQKVFDATFSGWNCVNNYASHSWGGFGMLVGRRGGLFSLF